jgi:nucleoside 2-deoxyribosyltransferase
MVNENAIRECDVLLGVLDGAEVDSGTAAEIGFAAASAKKCFGLRTDWRDSGEFGLALNLQVLHFIQKSGGRLFRSIEEIEL